MCKNKVLTPTTLIKDIEADDKGIIKLTYVNYETFGWDKEGNWGKDQNKKKLYGYLYIFYLKSNHVFT